MLIQKNKLEILLLIFLAFFLTLKPVYANPKAEFDTALDLYKNAQYDEAKTGLIALLQNNPESKFQTSAMLLLAKVYENLQDYENAKRVAKNFIVKFPKSRYKTDAVYVLASSSLKEKKYTDAFEYFLLTYEAASNSVLAEKSENYAAFLATEHLTSDEIKTTKDTGTWDKTSTLLSIWHARQLKAEGKKTQADNILKNILASPQQNKYSKLAKTLLNTPAENLYTKKNIGVILPLSGFFSAEANDFLKGMAFALSESRSTNKPNLIIRDSKGTTSDAIHAANDLLDKEIDILVGELEGSNSAAIAALAADKNTPIFIPLATNNNLHTLGENVFQINTNLETDGASLAEYAFNELNLKTFAMLAPADDYGHDITDAFSNKIDELGGRIISQQWYYPGTESYKKQFDAIREAGFRYAIRDSIQSKKLSATPARVDSFFKAWNRDVKISSEDKKGLIESYDIPVTSIDGFFLPIYEEDIDYIVPQFALANVNSQPLGGKYWLNEKILERHRTYIDGIIFSANYYLAEMDPNYRKFINKFRMTTSQTPGKYAVNGYNLMNFLLKAIDEHYATGQPITTFVKTSPYHGLGSSIFFNKSENTNSSIKILQFKDGNID